MSKFSLNTLGKALAGKTGLSQTESELFIKKMFDVLNQGLQSEKIVKVRGLGTFKVTSVKDRESINVNTGERILIEGRDKISFTPDNILKEVVNKPFAQFETVVVNDGVDFDAIDKKFETPPLEDSSVETEPMPVAAEPSMGQNVLEPSSSATEETEEEEQSATNDVPKQQNEVGECIVQKEEENDTVQETSKITSGKEEISDQEEKKADVVELMPNKTEEQEALPNEEVVPENYVQVKSHHIVLPRYIVAIIIFFFVILAGGIGWLAFSYGKMEAERDLLASQLHASKQMMAIKQKAKKHNVEKGKTSSDVLRQKALEDSMRMAQASEAIKNAEQVETAKTRQKQEPEAVDNKELSKTPTQPEVKTSSKDANKYDKDIRVRTGAYNIVGISETIVAKKGQSLKTISERYLGPGMECYVEAVNGNGQITEGQKIKIPKLELKKKK